MVGKVKIYLLTLSQICPSCCPPLSVMLLLFRHSCVLLWDIYAGVFPSACILNYFPGNRVLQGCCVFVGQPKCQHHPGSLDKKPSGFLHWIFDHCRKKLLVNKNSGYLHGLFTIIFKNEHHSYDF